MAHFDQAIDGIIIYFAPTHYFGMAKYNHLLDEMLGGGFNIAFDEQNKLAILSTTSASKRFYRAILEDANRHSKVHITVEFDPRTDSAQIFMVDPPEAAAHSRIRIFIQNRSLALELDELERVLSIKIGDATRQLHSFLFQQPRG